MIKKTYLDGGERDKTSFRNAKIKTKMDRKI